MAGFTIDEVGAANLFIMSRGRHFNQTEDRNVLVQVLREFARHGVRSGLQKSKELFRSSSDARGGCLMLSKGRQCDCFLCKIDAEISAIE